MAGIMIAWIALVAVMCFSSSTLPLKIYSVDLARKLRGISENGLGHKKIQNVFDTKATFQTNLPNGEKTVQMLASSLGERLNQYNKAIETLRDVLMTHYDKVNNANNTKSIQECCIVQDSNLPFLEKFNSRVDITTACARRTHNVAKVKITLPREIKEILRSNNKNNINLAWQYFGSETGFTIVYPLGTTSHCRNYDPRFRPWYAEASAQAHKDIVIVFENTVGKMAKDITKAVEILLNTANPNDRITVIALSEIVKTYVGSSEYSPCYSQYLALATPLNRRAFLAFVKECIPSETPIVNYLQAIDKAFDYFKKSAEETMRSKLLVFMAASDPSDVKTPNEIINKISQKNYQNVVIQTYAFGKRMSVNTRSILRAMAENTQFITRGNIIKKGTYMDIDPDTELRVQLTSYYNIFADSTDVHRPLVTVPYVDQWGLGLIVSLCLPVYSSRALHGVACVDAKIEDIFFNVTYYPEDSDTYVFIIDSWGRTIIHPSLPKPIAIQDDQVFIDIITLERGKDVIEIIESMKSGANGSKTIYAQSARHQPGSRQAYFSQYNWMKVPYTDYSLCIVFIDNDGTIEIDAMMEEKYVTYLHPNALVSTVQQATPCQHAGTVATKDGSVVMFSGAAYRWLTSDVKPFDENQRQMYDNFFKFHATDQGEAFKRSTQLWVTLSGLVDTIWKQDTSSRFDSVIFWRHLVTATGVIRVYPGTLYSSYDPHVLSWYKLAIQDPGSLIMGHTKQNNMNLILSQAIYKGSLDGHHTMADKPVAVVAGEIKATFVYNLLEDLYPACKDARCFILDQTGNVLAHKSYTENEQQISHLITLEPAIAMHLQETDQMSHTSCLNFELYRTLSAWTLTLKDFVVTSEMPPFELHAVPGTNVFVGIAWTHTNPIVSPDFDRITCKCQNVTKCLRFKVDHCQCPCYETLRFNFCNNTLPQSELNAAPTCLITERSFDIIQPPPHSVTISELKPCFAISCIKAHTSRKCQEIGACTWCEVEGKGEPECHETSQHPKCLRPVVVAQPTSPNCIPLVIICCLLILLLPILLFLQHRYRSRMPKCAINLRCLDFIDTSIFTKASRRSANPQTQHRPPAKLPMNLPPDRNATSLKQDGSPMSSVLRKMHGLTQQGEDENEKVYYEVVEDLVLQCRKAKETAIEKIWHREQDQPIVKPSWSSCSSACSHEMKSSKCIVPPISPLPRNSDDGASKVDSSREHDTVPVAYDILRRSTSGNNMELCSVDAPLNNSKGKGHLAQPHGHTPLLDQQSSWTGQQSPQSDQQGKWVDQQSSQSDQRSPDQHTPWADQQSTQTDQKSTWEDKQSSLADQQNTLTDQQSTLTDQQNPQPPQCHSPLDYRHSTIHHSQPPQQHSPPPPYHSQTDEHNSLTHQHHSPEDESTSPLHHYHSPVEKQQPTLLLVPPLPSANLSLKEPRQSVIDHDHASIAGTISPVGHHSHKPMTDVMPRLLSPHASHPGTEGDLRNSTKISHQENPSSTHQQTSSQVQHSTDGGSEFHSMLASPSQDKATWLPHMVLVEAPIDLTTNSENPKHNNPRVGHSNQHN